MIPIEQNVEDGILVLFVLFDGLKSPGGDLVKKNDVNFVVVPLLSRLPFFLSGLGLHDILRFAARDRTGRRQRERDGTGPRAVSIWLWKGFWWDFLG